MQLPLQKGGMQHTLELKGSSQPEGPWEHLLTGASSPGCGGRPGDRGVVPGAGKNRSFGIENRLNLSSKKCRMPGCVVDMNVK